MIPHLFLRKTKRHNRYFDLLCLRNYLPFYRQSTIKQKRKKHTKCGWILSIIIVVVSGQN